MDFVFGGGGGGTGTNNGLGHENGPILYSEPNRTSAIDDIRSVVIYIFIITIFLSFFLILPGIRNEKFPTFLCITTSLLVTSIILVALFGTTWHVGEAPISAAYKAFSRDRIQGELSVKIGFQSVNITLIAHKYYILHATDGPIIIDNSASLAASSSSTTASSSSPTPTPAPTQSSSSSSQPSHQTTSSPSSFTTSANSESSADVGLQSGSAAASSFINQDHSIGANGPPDQQSRPASNLAEELLGGRTSDGIAVDTELEVDEVFAPPPDSNNEGPSRRARSSSATSSKASTRAINSKIRPLSKSLASQQQVTSGPKQAPSTTTTTTNRGKRQTSSTAQRPLASNLISSSLSSSPASFSFSSSSGSSPSSTPKYTIKRVNVDINFNERFYWIEPNQMRQEHHNALQRGLPYPILTVVEYLSQDEAGFSWSRQYRLAGYYSSILLWLSLCACVLMFCLHCAAPKYGIYTMQVLGCLLLFTNLTYATLVPRGEQKLVIPFEGQSLSFRFGWNFWLVLIGGCLSLIVGTIIVIIDALFPNFIFTTVLDVNFDSHQKYYKKKRIFNDKTSTNMLTNGKLERPTIPPFLSDSASKTSVSLSSSSGSTIQEANDSGDDDYDENGDNNVQNNNMTKQQQQESPTNNRSILNSQRNIIRHRAIIKADADGIQDTQSSMLNNKNAPVDKKEANRDLSATASSSRHLSELFVGPLISEKQSIESNVFVSNITSNNSEIGPIRQQQIKQDSSIVNMLESDTTRQPREDGRTNETTQKRNLHETRHHQPLSSTSHQHREQQPSRQNNHQHRHRQHDQQQQQQQNHYRSHLSKNSNLKGTDDEARRHRQTSETTTTSNNDAGGQRVDIRL